MRIDTRPVKLRDQMKLSSCGNRYYFNIFIYICTELKSLDIDTTKDLYNKIKYACVWENLIVSLSSNLFVLLL